MQVYFLDRSPVLAANALGDPHVHRMLQEACQILNDARRVEIGDVYRPYNPNGRFARWARDSWANTAWLHRYADWLWARLGYPTGKAECVVDTLLYPSCTFADASPPPSTFAGWTFPSSDRVSTWDEVVAAYRVYYAVKIAHAKKRLDVWAAGPPPWWADVQQAASDPCVTNSNR